MVGKDGNFVAVFGLSFPKREGSHLLHFLVLQVPNTICNFFSIKLITKNNSGHGGDVP